MFLRWCVLFLMCPLVRAGYLWGWLLPPPGVAEENQVMLPKHLTFQEVERLRRLQIDQKSGPCKNPRDCPRGQFCDHHYGVCQELLRQDQFCREDYMCQKGMWCLFGRCQPRVRHGSEGSRCQKGSDCDRGMCCARLHGEKLCQRLLTKGQRCHVSPGGLHYSLNELCPCDRGLTCTALPRLNRTHEQQLSPIDYLRCSPV